MRSKLDPLVLSEWHAYYLAADRRRRHAGWHRRSESRTSKAGKRRGLDAGKALMIGMGLCTVAVILCLVLPA